MGKYVCECGLDCKTHLAFKKHTAKCEDYNRDKAVTDHPDFTNPFETTDVCPVCKNFHKSFYPLNSNLWVCLECGLSFMPNAKLQEKRGEKAMIKWKRNNPLT